VPSHELIAFLDAEGAGDVSHSRGRSLLDHLVDTAGIVRRWAQPEWLADAALIHSVYGTEAFHAQLVSLSRRSELATVAGDRAERLAYLFSVTPRRPLLAGTHLWARNLPSVESATRDELDALVLLHMANIAEQASGLWLARLRELAELLPESDRPLFTTQLASFDEEDEALTRTAYLDGLAGDGSEARLALAAAACPVVAEPCVWLAHLAASQDDDAASRAWAAQARKRLWALGTAWDKRRSFDDWLAAIDSLESRANDVSIAPRDAEAGRTRFQRYVEGFVDDGRRRPGLVYPDLPSRPWHDPRDFPLVAYLESHFDEIRAELLALTDFHPESERIGRTGDWDVAFLYERGRRHDDACDACPVTTRGVEMHSTVRTLAGLIYVSRMRAHTHIEAHRGPTNLRVRCHLGLQVPDGDCAIRVGDETRRWDEGRCLVFDDHFEHEAWNHTDDDRVVLIVDLWHPALSDAEVRLLGGLDTYTQVHAERLARYWSTNARAVRT
jgi:Aspartyl/Asparaginyl beta-hydroxylase